MPARIVIDYKASADSGEDAPSIQASTFDPALKLRTLARASCPTVPSQFLVTFLFFVRTRELTRSTQRRLSDRAVESGQFQTEEKNVRRLTMRQMKQSTVTANNNNPKQRPKNKESQEQGIAVLETLTEFPRGYTRRRSQR